MQGLGLILFFLVAMSAAPTWAATASHDETSDAAICQGYGPQTPRDIDQKAGTNRRMFSAAPPSDQMNLCNIHFHVNAEHRAAEFSIEADRGADGEAMGYQCNVTPTLSAEALAPLEGNACRGVEPGSTIEVHWVYTSCDVHPGEGLGSCLSEACANPNLRVEAQVFVLVNDRGALDFATLGYGGTMRNGYHQPEALPDDTGDPVAFQGSTTGPSFDEQQCSPLQVTWSVRPRCAELDIASLSAWCADNVFAEDYGHGIRELVTHPELLAPID
jgi:hypothetical protein